MIRKRGFARRGALSGVLTVVFITTALPLAITAAASAATWVPIDLNTANWSGNADFGSVPPAAYFDGPQNTNSSFVHLQGAVKQTSRNSQNGSNPNWIGTLPFSDWPARNVYTIVHTFAGTYADLSIGTDGQIFLIPSSATNTQFVSLEGISFQGRVAGGAAISLNTANWSANVCCGASSPGVLVTGENGTGIYHLLGAVTQISSSGPNPDFIGTLPVDPGDAPNRTVYTIVHTFGGTYADLAITPQGQIFLIPLRGLTQSDTRFVSLEGVTFPTVWTDGFGPSSGWGDGCCGAGPIGWWEDDAGFIHLTGAVSQASSFLTPIATLLPQIRPSRNLFFVVHTGSGTFADLSIDTNGVINVIPAMFPEPSNLSFVSLEGISYDAPTPEFFGLGVRGTASHGATVTVNLRKPRVLALLVQVMRRHRLVTVGVVHLGTRPAGRSRIHWNLRVNRRGLGPGRYEVSLRALNGRFVSMPAPPGDRGLVVLADGHVRAK